MNVKKRLVSALLLLCVCLSAAACGNDKVSVPSDMQLASRDSDSFYLMVPKSWTLNTDSDFASAYYSLEDPSNVSVFVYSPATSMSVEEYWKSYVEEYKSSFPTMEVVSESTEATLGGHAAGKYEFTAESSGKNYKFMQLIAAGNGLFYIFTYTALADNYDAHISEVDTIVENFIFK